MKSNDGKKISPLVVLDIKIVVSRQAFNHLSEAISTSA